MLGLVVKSFHDAVAGVVAVVVLVFVVAVVAAAVVVLVVADESIIGSVGGLVVN